jgi:hypothetical protein
MCSPKRWIDERNDVERHALEKVTSLAEKMGIHYPSDNEASRVIGWHLLEALRGLTIALIANGF